MKIIFFGAGVFAYNAWKDISLNLEIYQDEYLAFADNNPELWDTYFCDRKVIAPVNIHSYNPDLIVITSTYDREIKTQLIEKLNIACKKIYTYGDYLRKCHVEWIYRKKYNITDSKGHSGIKMERKFVVYTAIIGDYDSLKDPEFVSDDLTYVCFTNNRKLKSEVWNIEYIRDDKRNNVHLARCIKLNPHVYFPDYEVSIWVDGKFQIIGDLRTYANQYKKKSPVLCFPHPERESISDEVAACIIWNKENKEKMIIQVSDYLKEGYPAKYGLYETGCMVRDHNDEFVKKLMNDWQNEIMKYSVRDQLSFPYVCWKNHFVPDISNLDINRNGWLQLTGHLPV